MYNLVVTDLDGTLLNTNHRVDDYTKKVLQDLYNANINIVIATGRSYIDAKRVKNQLELPIPMITTNGASLYDFDDTELFKYLIDENIAKSIVNMNYKQYGSDIIINIICEEKWLVNEKISKDHIINEWAEPTWKYEYSTKDSINTKEISKFFFFGEHDELVKLEEYILSNFGNMVNCAFTLPFCFEIFSKKATKGNALIDLAKIKGYDLDKAIAFGDGFNDVEMLKEVKKGFIMENASDELKMKNVELEVIGPNSKSSVARKIKEIFNI